MYHLVYDRRIEKDLRPIPLAYRRLILSKLESLIEQPRRPQVEKLSGVEGYRLRVGDYRVLFTINDQAKQVTIYRIKHRGSAYR